MTVCREVNLEAFDFWAGAKSIAEWLNPKDFEIIESALEDIFYDRIPTETEINDFFWFEPDTIAEWLGFRDWEDLEDHREEPYI